jgi:hypothetical protein
MRSYEKTDVQGVHVWLGASGREYRYSIYMFGTAFGPGAANFIFAREFTPGRNVPLYIGHTNDLSVPFPNFVIAQCIKLRRVTHVHVHFNETSEEIRRAERSDLIAQWNPPCNQMR